MNCIYGSGSNLSREHYLPACLGSFNGYQPLDDRVCAKCNTACGKLDEQLCRSAGEAFFRRLLEIGGRKHHQKVDPSYRGSSGGGRLVLQGRSVEAGRTIPLEFDPTGVRELRHIAFIADDDTCHVIPIPNDMKDPAQLRAAFEALGIEHAKEAHVYADEDEVPWIDSLLQGLKAERQVEWSSNEGPTAYTNVGVTFTLTDRYFRCLAKIGFHHFLQKMPQFVGSEDCFADIREFIMIDGTIDRVDRFVSVTPQMVFQIARGQRPAAWGHLVTAEVDYLQLGARLQLFLGPEYIPPVFTIKLGRNPSRLYYEDSKATSFAYYPKEERGPFDGEVTEAQPLRLL